ncbi:ABC transporter substrate-binding protein [Rhizohabitans arisaemae]|uniref:ABC transporter substrate-binding protein n=1 Tax=Rhizohabitans arisaemae TaxID=2720610 RepID=UPI0024B1C84E|nr:ABC transporter substrate-binding protein [Rhizohabitans arisaemae]
MVIKRSSIAVAGLLALLLTAGCGGSSTSAGTVEASGGSYGGCEVTGKRGEFTLKPVVADTLSVQGDLPSPGWWNGDTVAAIKDGFEYCMAATIAHRAGLSKLAIENTPFDALVSGRTQNFDLALAEISITDERKQVVNFSTPYFASNIGVMAKKGADVTAQNIRTLRLGVKQGTAGALWVMNTLKPEQQPKVFTGDPEMSAALQAGQIDAAFQDVAIMLGSAVKSNGLLEVVGQYDTGESYGALYPKDSPNAETLNKIIDQMKADGTFDRLSATYLSKAFGGDPARIPLWTTR